MPSEWAVDHGLDLIVLLGCAGSSPIDMTPPDGVILIRSAPLPLQRRRRPSGLSSGCRFSQ
jgi:hypothetical protein